MASSATRTAALATRSFAGQRLERIGKLMAKGVGLMCAHYGVEVPKDLGGKEFQEWIGGYYEHMYSCNPMWSPEFKEFPKHPIANGVKPFTIRDEWYFNMRFRDDMKAITPILVAKPSRRGARRPVRLPEGAVQAHSGGEGPRRDDDVGRRAQATAAAASASPAATTTATGRTTTSARWCSTRSCGSARWRCRRRASLQL